VRFPGGAQALCAVLVGDGHTVPSVVTLEKMARALEVPLYQLFYEGKKPPKLPKLPKRKTAEEIAFGISKKEARYLVKFRRLLARMDESRRRLLLHMAQKMARRYLGGLLTPDGHYYAGFTYSR